MKKLLLSLMTLLMSAGYMAQCPTSLPTPSITGSTQVCAPSSGTLTVSAGIADTYTWSSSTGSLATSASTLQINPTISTTYSVIAGVAGCTLTSAAAITVTVNTAVPVLTVTSSRSLVMCAYQSFTLTANGANAYVWHNGVTTADNSLMAPLLTNTPSVSRTYSVTGTNACGQSTAVVTATINPSPLVSVSPSSATICVGEIVSLSAGSTANNYTWWENSTAVSTAPSFTVQPSVTTSYHILSTFSASTNCYGGAFVNVNVMPCTSIDETKTTIDALAYPSPMQDELHIQVSAAGEMTYVLTDLLGKIVLKGDFTSPEITINTGILPQGYYILNVKAITGEVLFTKKMIK